MSPLGSFHIGVSSDFRRESAGLLDPVLCEQFEPLRAITYDFDLGTGEIAPDRLGEYDAVISSARARYTADSLWGVERLAVISRCAIYSTPWGDETLLSLLSHLYIGVAGTRSWQLIMAFTQ